MAVLYKINIEYDFPPETTIRVMRAILKQVFKEIGDDWKTRKLPMHFTPQAEKIYGYESRGYRYLKYKRNSHRVESGGTCPLVFSGLTRRLAKASALSKGFPTRTSVTMNVPSYVTRRPQDNKPYLLGELTKVTEQEKQEYAEYFVRRMAELLSQTKLRKRRRIR